MFRAIIQKLLRAASDRLPCRIISDNDQPYLERYYLATVFGVRLYLHRFVGSDPDRGLHDHPWPWALSLILSGWYFEERRDTVGKPGAGYHVVQYFNFLSGDNFHRVILPRDVDPAFNNVPEVWTLFAHSTTYSKPWGFLRQAKGPHGGLAPVHTWVEYSSTNSRNWWLTAPKGRDTAGRAI